MKRVCPKCKQKTLWFKTKDKINGIWVCDRINNCGYQENKISVNKIQNIQKKELEKEKKELIYNKSNNYSKNYIMFLDRLPLIEKDNFFFSNKTIYYSKNKTYSFNEERAVHKSKLFSRLLDNKNNSSKYLYAPISKLDITKKIINFNNLKNKKLVFSEGYIDASCYSYVYKIPFSFFGGFPSKEQIIFLEELALNKIKLFFIPDHDKAGFDVIKKLDSICRIVFYPNKYKDYNEFFLSNEFYDLYEREIIANEK